MIHIEFVDDGNIELQYDGPGFQLMEELGAAVARVTAAAVEAADSRGEELLASDVLVEILRTAAWHLSDMPRVMEKQLHGAEALEREVKAKLPLGSQGCGRAG